MPEHQRLGHEQQIAVDHADLEDGTDRTRLGSHWLRRLHEELGCPPAVLPRGSTGARGRGPGPGRRTNGAKALRTILQQRIHDRGGGRLVAEVIEVRDLASPVEQERRARRARRSAVHRARLHDEVVFRPEKRVGQQCLDPRDDRVAFDVARDHAELARDRSLRRIEPAHQRAVGNLRRKSGQQLGIGAAPCHLPQKLDERRHDGNARKLECPFDDRDVGIEAFGSEQRAARRAGDPHNPLDPDLALCRDVAQSLQRVTLRPIRGSLEERKVARPQRGVRTSARQHLGHQAATGMGNEVQASSGRADVGERQRVFDRADAECRMLEAEYPLPVVIEQRFDALGVLQP